MNNKIVYNLYHTFAKHDFATLRINFRGVGKSEGTFDDGIGELTDAASALDWLQSENPSSKFTWIAGFSFGSWIAMQLLMRRPEVDSFIAVSPPVHKYDFSFLAPCPVPGLVLQGDQDSIVPEDRVTKFVKDLLKQKVKIDYEIIKNSDHFFRNSMDKVMALANDYIIEKMNATGAAEPASKQAKKHHQKIGG